MPSLRKGSTWRAENLPPRNPGRSTGGVQGRKGSHRAPRPPLLNTASTSIRVARSGWASQRLWYASTSAQPARRRAWCRRMCASAPSTCTSHSTPSARSFSPTTRSTVHPATGYAGTTGEAVSVEFLDQACRPALRVCSRFRR